MHEEGELDGRREGDCDMAEVKGMDAEKETWMELEKRI